MTEHYDNAWDTELTPELEAALNTDDDPLCDHTMTTAEADALRGQPNLPKIPVRSCPPPPCPYRNPVPHKVVNYRVHIETAASKSIDLTFNSVPPIPAIIEAALQNLEENLPQPADNGSKDDYDHDMSRLECLIAIIRLVPVLHIPTAGKSEDHEVRVAGVYVGKVRIVANEAWEL